MNNVSMTIHTIVQFIELFSAYTIMSIVLPAFVLRDRLRTRRLTERFVYYFLCGNFYMMHIVFLLQLLHISNRLTIWLSTFLTIILFEYLLRKDKFIKNVKSFFVNIHRLYRRQLGIKNAVAKIDQVVSSKIINILKGVFNHLCTNPIRWILFSVFMSCIMYVYGTKKLIVYGYTASDIPVHLSWINGMLDGVIFSDGIYPFGFHCVVYYINRLFGIDVYVILRLMALVQTVYIHLMLLLFLKLVCKNKYLPYAAVFIFTIGSYFRGDTYWRYHASLPQEFGMLFILPAVYYAFAYFKDRREEIKSGQKINYKNCFSTYSLSGFAMALAMTLIVHFYGTMITALFGVGAIIGYAVFLVRKKYFVNIFIASIVAVMIAVLPMGISYALGTPLQGSLNWGMNVIKGDENGDGVDDDDNEASDNVGDVEDGEYHFHGDGYEQSLLEKEAKKQSTVDKLKGYAKKAIDKLVHIPRDYKTYYEMMKLELSIVVFGGGRAWYGLLIVICVGLLLVGGVLSLFVKEYGYACSRFSTAWFWLFITILQCAELLHIPGIMNASRCSFYYAYLLPVVLAMGVDTIFYIISRILHLKFVQQLCGLIVVGIVLYDVFCLGTIKQIEQQDTGLEMNEAITCLTNIIRDEKDFTWILISANDETQMIKEHGWHYELSTLMREVEVVNRDSVVKLPAKTLYFFVEKVPLEYASSDGYQNAGQSISARGASMSLPSGSGLAPYLGRSRWILMSRLYYFAETLKKMYPSDMTVYMETDKFICYRLKQNEYWLYNLAVDYGFNKVGS